VLNKQPKTLDEASVIASQFNHVNNHAPVADINATTVRTVAYNHRDTSLNNRSLNQKTPVTSVIVKDITVMTVGLRHHLLQKDQPIAQQMAAHPLNHDNHTNKL
jgi:hypothetical protein